MTENVKPKRRYESKRRLEQARETRRAILDAAQRRFEGHGYARSPSRKSPPTPASQRRRSTSPSSRRAALLRALWNLLLRGERDDRPIAEQRWYREVLEEGNPERQLRLNARNSAQGKRRISSILEVIRSAASTDPEIDVLWQRIQSEYRENQRAIVERLADAQRPLPRPRRRPGGGRPLDDQPSEHVATARRATRLDARAVRAVVGRRSLPGTARPLNRPVVEDGLHVVAV